MKKILLFSSCLFACTFTKAQSQCANLDFEDTTFTNWTGYTGSTPASVLDTNYTWANGIVTTGPNAWAGDQSNRMTLITQNYVDSIAIDPVTMLPDTQMTSLAPNGGGVSVRIGNTNVGMECEKISYTLNVTQPYYMFQFATVMQDPGHNWDAQPYFMVNTFNQSGIIIPACSDTIWSADPNYPFIPSNNATYGAIQYRRWTPVSLDLSAYVGQNVTIEFVNSDCAFGGHFGYTYLDVSCLGGAIANTWPGDCDYDLQANDFDILPFAIAFGSVGTARTSASNSWVAQPSTDWSQSFAFNLNYKHSDCNGDGIVDLNDTTALIQNYGMNHPYRLAAPDYVQSTSTNTPLYLVPVNATVGPFNYVYVDVYAGSANIPASRLYGVAYSINYNTQLVQPGTFSWDYSGSTMGVRNTSMVAIDHTSTSQDEDAGIARIVPGEVSGTVYLGRMRFAVQNVSSLTTLHLVLHDAKAVNEDYVQIPMDLSGCDITIDPQLPAGVSQNSGDVHVNLFPNPATYETGVKISTSETPQLITITDVTGRVVLSVQPQNQLTQFNVADLNPGMYFVNVYTANGNSTQELMVQ